MYQNVVPLSATADAATRIATQGDWSFARNLTSVLVGADEVVELAKEYVIVFSREEPVMPIALLGLGDRNIYVDDQGRWRARTIPARLRTYPFVAGRGQSEETLVISRDADAPHFRSGEGIPLFDAQGQPSALLRQVSEALVAYDQDCRKAEALCRELLDAGLIEERRVYLQLEDDSHQGIDGFRAVVEEKLNGLSNEEFVALMPSGAMKLLAAHLESLKNFGYLLA